MNCEWGDKIFEKATTDFESLALELFAFQFHGNPVYRQFATALGRRPENVTRLEQIPFLPISFFKNRELKTSDFVPELLFESSGTTGLQTSRHLVKDAAIYRESFHRGFELFYGPVEDYCIIGLLPSYLERKHSSLVYMVEDLVKKSAHPDSGFYLYEHEKLASVLKRLEEGGRKTLLIGVTFGLLDFIENHSISLNHTIVMETGGMKGRREELVRSELHKILMSGFGISAIHSEYGMTELLSQAYSTSDGIFNCPPWMKVLLREEDDPQTLHFKGPCRGVVNVIDLANVYSCSFIATDDAGRLYEDGSFEILGRIDSSDIRGCSLLSA